MFITILAKPAGIGEVEVHRLPSKKRIRATWYGSFF